MSAFIKAVAVIAMLVALVWVADAQERLPVARTPERAPVIVPCEKDCGAILTLTFADAHFETIPAKSKEVCLQMAIDVTDLHNKSGVGKTLKPRSVLRSAKCD